MENDDTPGAQIHYTVTENGTQVNSGTVSSGGTVTLVVQEQIPYPSLGGTMYATAPGYSQSNYGSSLSF